MLSISNLSFIPHNKKFLIFSIGLIVSCNSFANLRAPRNISYAPSSNLYLLTDNAQVLQETMDVECDWKVCDVKVRYFIEINQPILGQTDFIVPEGVNVSAQIDSKTVVVDKKAVAYTDLREQDREVRLHAEDLPPLFKASLPLELKKGKHQIFIYYQQPLSQQEVAYGYFSQGYFISFFQYELWPLNEWNMSKYFRLDFTMSLKNTLTDDDWWDALFNDANIKCFSVSLTQCESGKDLCKTFAPIQSAHRESSTIVKYRLQAPFPDRLVCQISPEEAF